jgi:hypothetical protein
MKDFKNWIFEEMTDDDYEKRKKKLEKMLAVGLITKEEFDKNMSLLNLDREKGNT